MISRSKLSDILWPRIEPVMVIVWTAIEISIVSSTVISRLAASKVIAESRVGSEVHVRVLTMAAFASVALVGSTVKAGIA